ncbi:hypothetical protein FAI41_04110 [Acetobacteraceae bacterium]|nr:hypothetical protein FAI41_04110 [Acetobacteraceae bacterium]
MKRALGKASISGYEKRMMQKIFSPFTPIAAILSLTCLFALPSKASAQTNGSSTITDLKQNMGKNHFWMTMRTLPADPSGRNAQKPASKCLLAYIERPHFRKRINLALILSAEKNKILIQSGSDQWHLKLDEKGALNLSAGHWIHHFNMKASKTNEITAQMPEEEMRSLLNTLSRNVEGTLDYSSGKSVRLPLKNIAPEINDFKRCAQTNQIADLGELIPVPTQKGFFRSKDQAPKPAPAPNKPF